MSLSSISKERGFPDPFIDYMSGLMPRSMADVLQWAEKAWLHNGTYRQACRRVVRFFLTKIEYDGVDTDEQARWSEFHNNKFDVFSNLASCGDDFLCYGNSMSSIFVPFIRYLRCPRCSLSRPIIRWSYRFSDFKFFPKKACDGLVGGQPCRYTGELERLDRPSSNSDNIHVIRWSIHNMRVVFNPISFVVRYIYRIPATVKRSILSAESLAIETTPWEIVTAVKNNVDFEFNPGVIFHMKEPAVCGITNMGWGIPNILSNLRLIHHIQVLKYHNEAIGLDYIIPFRVITPFASSNQTADPLRLGNIGAFIAATNTMIKRRRRDPAQWNVLPFPITYSVYGGEGRELAPAELLTLATDELLAATGIPPELYRGTLTLQAAPTAIRLFMQSWRHWNANINGWLDWANSIIANAMKWDTGVRARMQPNTLADDLEKQQIQLQLASTNRISLGTALAPLGLDPKEEIEKRYSEQKLELEAQRKFQRDIENQEMHGLLQQSSGGVSGFLGGEARGGGGTSMTPMDMQARVDEIANQLVRSPSLTHRRRALDALRESNPEMHAMVKQRMEEIRQEAGSAGREQLYAPQSTAMMSANA